MPEQTMLLSTYLKNHETVLKDQWRTSLRGLLERVNLISHNTQVFDVMNRLILDLVALSEKQGSAEQAVDSSINPVLLHLKDLQSQNQLSPTEIAFFLFAMKDALRDSFEDPLEAEEKDAKNTLKPYTEAINQVSLLLNRLGLVFFESYMRAREEEGFNQDILAIEYALLYERTRQLAITDPLTGLHNFGYFRDRLKEERSRAERYQRLLSLILFDIDNFKIYNDANGHQAGNEVLKKIAGILQVEAREGDIVARYGGEEMVIILPETGRRDAHEMADRIRRRVAETDFDHMKSQPTGHLNISAGVATFPVDAANEEELIVRADKSLYQAKSDGRNRVVAYKPSHRITVTYRPDRQVARVSLVGSFNNWDKGCDHMVRQPDGTFQFVIALNPGVYNYKFVLDDTTWISDPHNPEYRHDNLGGDNSILRVVDPPNPPATTS